MKKSYSAALLPLAAILLMVAALALNIASPGTPAYAQSNNLTPSDDGPWLNPPVNVSRSSLYDNTPDIGASKIDGAVTVGWERRNEVNNANENFIMHASNTVLDGPFLQQSALKTDLKASGNVRVAGDGLGRRHMVWWATSGATCGY